MSAYPQRPDQECCTAEDARVCQEET